MRHLPTMSRKKQQWLSRQGQLSAPPGPYLTPNPQRLKLGPTSSSNPWPVTKLDMQRVAVTANPQPTLSASGTRKRLRMSTSVVAMTHPKLKLDLTLAVPSAQPEPYCNAWPRPRPQICGGIERYGEFHYDSSSLRETRVDRLIAYLVLSFKSKPGYNAPSPSPNLGARPPRPTWTQEEGVDLERTGNTVNVAWTVPGEWLTYTVQHNGTRASVQDVTVTYAVVGGSNGITLALDLDDPSECPDLIQGDDQVTLYLEAREYAL